MDKWQAQQAFWESFGIPAYDENTYYDTKDVPSYPHLTYQAMAGVMGQIETVSANVWYYDSSWKAISNKVDEILKQIIAMRTPIAIDGGYLWIRLNDLTPFAQRMASGTEDDMIKRVYLTVDVECLTAN